MTLIECSQGPGVLERSRHLLLLVVAACSAEALPLGEAFTIEPQVIDFEPTLVGASARERVTITNRTAEELAFTITRGPASSGTIVAALTAVKVAPNGSSGFDIAFTPSRAEPAQARFDVQAEGFEAKRIVASGTGIDAAVCSVAVTPNPLDFGDVVTRSRATRSLTLTNPCDTALNVELVPNDDVELCPPTGSPASTPFCFDSPSRVSVRPGDSRPLDVRFVPYAESGRERATASVRSCPTTACEIELTFIGNAIESGLECSPEMIDFGRVPDGGCRSQTITCTNAGNATVLIDAWGAESIGTPTSPDFEFEPYQLLVLESGDQFTTNVDYCPSDFGRDVGHFGVRFREETDEEKRIYVPLSGLAGGAALTATPNPLAFGEVSTIVPVERPLALRNTGTIALEIASMRIDGPNASSFSIPGGGPRILDAGAALTLAVQIAPATTGALAARLVVETNDPDVGTFTVPLSGTGVSLPPCRYGVATSDVRFGPLATGREQTIGVEIANTGPNDCLLTRGILSPQSSEAFVLLDPVRTTRRIAAGTTTVLRVRYRPTSLPSSSGAIQLELSSPTAPTATINLVGHHAEPPFVVSPNRVDFGDLAPGCGAPERDILVENQGTGPAQITSITIDGGGSAFALTNVPALPATLQAPLGTLQFGVTYTSGVTTEHAGAIRLEVLVQGTPVTQVIPLSARTTPNPTVQTLRPLTSNQADVLIVVRDRPSTTEERTILADLFGAFTSFADINGVDYQIGVTTMTADEIMGRLIHPGGNTLFGGPAGNKIITQATPSAGSIFETNLLFPFNPVGVPDRGLLGARHAFTSDRLDGDNAGFLRPEASLSIVFLSDSDDFSPGPDAAGYARAFASIKEDRQRVWIHTITAGAMFCTGPTGSAAATPRFSSVADGSTSICTTDWTRDVESVAPLIFGYRTSHRLHGAADPNTIEVTINGMTIPRVSTTGTVNWAYDAGLNAIDFSPFFAPTPGDSAVVRYATVCL